MELRRAIRCSIKYFAIGVNKGRDMWETFLEGAENVKNTINTSENSVVNFLTGGQSDAGRSMIPPSEVATLKLNETMVTI
jgi:hypothetical protein